MSARLRVPRSGGPPLAVAVMKQCFDEHLHERAKGEYPNQVRIVLG